MAEEITDGFVAFSSLICKECKQKVPIYFFGVCISGRFCVEGVCSDCGKTCQGSAGFDRLLYHTHKSALEELRKDMLDNKHPYHKPEENQ